MTALVMFDCEALMQDLDIPFELNTLTTDTMALFFSQVAAQHADLNLKPTTHYILRVQQLPTRYEPWQSVAIVKAFNDPQYEQLFRYNRWPVSRYIANPVFTEAELGALQSASEVELVEALRRKYRLNINTQDFVIRSAGVVHTGGTDRPNWRLRAAPDSPFWYDDTLIWLHAPPTA